MTAILMGLLLLIIFKRCDRNQKWYSIFTSISMAWTWNKSEDNRPIKIFSGHKQPVQVNKDIAADYQHWLPFNFFIRAFGRKEEEEKTTKEYVLT